MPSPKPLQVADSAPLGDVHYERYEIMVRCNCGHVRELRGEFVRRVIGLQTTIGELRRRLRCHKCGRKVATVEIFRQPR
jgi:hypothetical protein